MEKSLIANNDLEGTTSPASMEMTDTTVGIKARGPLGKVAPGLAQKIPEDVDEEVIVLWIAYFVHTLLTLFVWGPLASAASSGGVIAGFFQSFIFDFTPYLRWLAIEPFIHLILMPLFIQRKKQYVGEQRVSSLTKQQSNLDPEGKTVVFSIKFTLMQKIFIFFVGNWIKLIAFIIKLLSFIGIDLSCFWFPMPFFQFWLATLQVKNYRILGAKVRLNAIQADAYFKFLHEALCNFYTFGLYSKLWAKIKGKSYNKWLDQNVEWDGLPPPGCNNDFMIFDDKLSFIQKILLMFVDLFFGFAPFFQVIASYLGYKMRLKNLTFGGITPQFVPEFTFGLMLKHYLKSCCYFFGLCAAKEKKFVDMNIGPLVVDVEAAGAGITAPSGMAPTYLAPAPLPMMTHGATQ